MSAETVEASAPKLNLNAEEKRVYGWLFSQADSDNSVVTGEVAVRFFEKTRLDSRILGEIWQIADHENRGFLTPGGFGIALRLIGHAQAGREPSHELALQQGPLPRFDGINIPGPPPAPLQAQGTGIRIPPLTPEKVAQYAGLFEVQNLQNGSVLPGDQAKNIFEKSGLPNEVLGRIWQLSDTEGRGGLVMTEFVIAMHLLTSMKSGALRGLPTQLPAALYEAATRRPTSRQSPTAPGAPISAIPRQLSGTAQPRTASPLGRPPIGPQATGIPPQATGFMAPQTSGSNWLITPADKARFDQFFADLDKTGKGFITGEEAVPFLSQSSLPEDALAQIWDLADINSEGRLNKDTFAVAMYLIRQQRNRKDMPLPTSLPPNLIPPSLRTQAQPQAPPQLAPSPFDPPAPAPVPAPVVAQPPPPPPQPKSAIDDLFGLDAMPGPAPSQSALSPQGTGGSRGGAGPRDPFGGRPASANQASPTGKSFAPFIPSSSFGRNLTAHDTGGSAASSQKPPAEDLLGDNDPEISKKLTNESTELANLSNQIGSLSKQMQNVQGQRASTQNEITQASEQKKNFEQRLSQLRTLYEKEAEDVRTLEEQLRTVREETRKLTSEMTQHQQLYQAFSADQQENQNLKQRISVVNQEIAQLKPQIEKLKSDARQQKGMVAINKKQLSSVEEHRDKMHGEIEGLTKIAAPAQVASPAPSTTSANNPFFRRTGSADIMGAMASSPPVKPYGEKSFDDIFGPSSSGTPPPMTSFKQQNTGTSSASVGSGSFATPQGSTPTVPRAGGMEPPPAPESRQISSSFLPFGETGDSLTSSRQVSPPLSRTGDGPAATPLEPATTGQSAASASDAHKSTLAPPFEQRPASAAANGSVPGAFPDDPKANLPTRPFTSHRDSDPFGHMKDNSGNAKIDFDSAFAGFEPQKKSTADPVNNFNQEFPPISELQRDDDSDSASEGNGFDDDFAPTSPPTKKADDNETPHAPSSPATTKPVGTSSDDAATAQATQPSNLSDLSAFPSPPKVSPTAPAQAKEQDPFGSAANNAPAAPKGAFDDLDDDFEGLEDAKEGSADDEFANISRDDFNPVFDGSPPPSQPKSESTNVSTAFGTNSSYDFGNVSTTSAATQGGAGAPANNSTATGGTTAGQPPATADNQDWDAIFASLDSPTEAATPRKSGDDSKSPVQQSAGSPRPETLGRALTEEGKHDDPIVKELTSMGYSRNDAVDALEKHNYNLERAANYLASRS
ncbi:hypothetical protein F4780DRAFT_773379 [Xylariomycetidae sp. FL0641]|nr:hypothetical protein F4780DRAFT_773379 [Xylariomycetidae sp. FL0641]